jgi:reverse gyrase
MQRTREARQETPDLQVTPGQHPDNGSTTPGVVPAKLREEKRREEKYPPKPPHFVGGQLRAASRNGRMDLEEAMAYANRLVEETMSGGDDQ